MNDNNPLLDFSGLPRFESIRPAHVTPAVDSLLDEARATIGRVASDASPPSWESVVEPTADVLDRFDRAWGAVRHLNAVVNTPELRDAYNANLPKVIEFFSDLSQDLRLYARYRALRESAAFASLDAGQRKLVDNEIRDFKLGGAALDDAGKERLKSIHAESNGAAHSRAAIPLATTAFMRRAPSRCVASRWRRATSVTARTRSSGQIEPPPRLLVCSTHTSRLRGKWRKSGRMPSSSAAASYWPRAPSSERTLTPASAPGPPVSKWIGCAVRWASISSPGRQCTRSAISLHMVPDGRKTAASLPSSSATIVWS